MELKDLKGVGQKTLDILHSKKIYSLEDLITFYPIAYNEFNADELVDGKVQVSGEIFSNINNYMSKNGVNITSFYLYVNGRKIKVIVFNKKFITYQYKNGEYVKINGIYDSSKNTIVLDKISKPDMNLGNLIPVYSFIKNYSSYKINKLILEALDHFKEYANYSDLQILHNPNDIKSLSQAIYNLKYDEFYNYMSLIKKENENSNKKSAEYKKNVKKEDIENFIDKVPFVLTDDQYKAIIDLYNNFNSDKLSKTLILGDVGSGKTIVAIAAAYIMAKQGYQVAIMAPTSILCTQIYNQVQYLCNEFNTNILLGNTTSKAKRAIYESLLVGDIDIIVGTHSLVEAEVRFKNLGLTIIDEQHRFGVNQRQKLADKAQNVESISMSATPIPRTLAMSFFNILDVIEIRTKPRDRQKIDTKLYNRTTRSEMMKQMESYLKKNEKVFVIAPTIEQSEIDNVTNVMDVYNAFSKRYKNKYNVDIVHGLIKNKQEVIEKFRSGSTDLLIATTVVEVGIDIPDATCIVILNAERFGVATLHQLRGRVGRNEKNSSCLLYNMSSNPESKKRLNLLVKYDDGFKLSEEDLKNRGSGDFFGVMQTGAPDFKIFDYQNDQDIALQVINEINQKKN